MNVLLESKIPGCDNFYWHEVLWLEKIGACVYPPNKVAGNLVEICEKLEAIRGLFNKPIKITSGYRPDRYNKIIGGATYSQHRLGKAIDFRVKNYKCDDVRDTIQPYLKDLDIRMEDKPGSSWVHIDTKQVNYGMKRFFIP